MPVLVSRPSSRPRPERRPPHLSFSPPVPACRPSSSRPGLVRSGTKSVVVAKQRQKVMQRQLTVRRRSLGGAVLVCGLDEAVLVCSLDGAVLIRGLARAILVRGLGGAVLVRSLGGAVL